MTAPTQHDPRLMRLAVLFSEAGCPDRAEKVQLVGLLLERPDLTSTNQLTDDEIRKLTRWLREDPLLVDRARRKRDEAGQAKPEKKRRRKKAAACSDCGQALTTSEEERVSGLCLRCLNGPPPALVAAPVLPPGEWPPLEPVPDDLEAAVQDAADRFHARGGVVPPPPHRSEIPPRVPVPHTAVGRYCIQPPGTCYCGACPHWEPAPPVNYKAAIAALREKQTGGRR